MMKRVLTISALVLLLCFNVLAQGLPAVFPKYVARNERIEPFDEKNLIPFQEKLNSIRESHENLYEAYKALERDALSKFPDYTFMVGEKSYTLKKPQGGDVMGKIYTNGVLSFVHYYKEANMVLLRVQYSEGSSFLLINLENEQEIELISPPIFNENKTRILTYANQGEADYGAHGFRLLRKNENGIYSEYFSYDTTPLGPVYAEWENDDLIKMKFVPRWQGMGSGTQYYRIKIEETH